MTFRIKITILEVASRKSRKVKSFRPNNKNRANSNNKRKKVLQHAKSCTCLHLQKSSRYAQR